MKLLLITQAVDTKDTFLAFMHSWIATFAPKYESITVICLKKGEYNLPENVRVFSLGKESSDKMGGFQKRFFYIKNFYKHIFAERNSYDAVLVHMNQEYVVLGGFFWKLMGKRVYMWRNHHAGSWITNLAAALCTNVFCTSRFSYTARFKKTILMPVGVDTNIFSSQRAVRVPRSILFLARIAPVKRPDMLIEALSIIHKHNVAFTASFVGDYLPKDREYAESLKKKVSELGLSSCVSFLPGVPNTKTIGVYNAHDVCVNLSTSGMFDKTIFEAMACGTLSLSSNANLIGEIDERLLYEEGNTPELAAKIGALLMLTPTEKEALRKATRQYVVEHHSLQSLSGKLFDMMSGRP